jgi:hypothetical protein
MTSEKMKYFEDMFRSLEREVRQEFMDYRATPTAWVRVSTSWREKDHDN